MRGQKYNDDIREKVYAMLMVNNNVSFIAKELGLPCSTVKSWKIRYDKEAEANGDIAKLRLKKREKFVDNAWKLVEDSLVVAQKRINKANNLEQDLDNLCKTIKKNAGKIEAETGIGWNELLNVIQEIKNFKSPRLSEISTLIGTIYDKQALANGEATSREEQILKGFEDY